MVRVALPPYGGSLGVELSRGRAPRGPTTPNR